MNETKIKICGLTSVEDARLLNDNQVDYAGIVLFYPKSKRNMELVDAKKIMDSLDIGIKKVAVTVSPTLEQVIQIEEARFDFIQIHGELSAEVLKQIHIPILRAFNITQENDFKTFANNEKIAGYVMDGKIPGGGKVFDWSLIKGLNRNNKLLLLAGGLNVENVLEGIHFLEPDIVDVSSGVENEIGNGKDSAKIKEFVKTVRMGK